MTRFQLLRAIGGLLLGLTLTGCWSPGATPAEDADPYRCRAGNIDYRLPTETLTDWVSFADQLSVVEVTGEHRGETERLEPGEKRAPWVGRRVDLRVVDTHWRRAGGPTAPETFTAQVDPWGVRHGRLEQVRVTDGPWLEIGRRYLTGLVRFDEGQWAPFPRSTMPLGPAGVVEATCQNHTTVASFTGMIPADVGAVLAKTPWTRSPWPMPGCHPCSAGSWPPPGGRPVPRT